MLFPAHCAANMTHLQMLLVLPPFHLPGWDYECGLVAHCGLRSSPISSAAYRLSRRTFMHQMPASWLASPLPMISSHTSRRRCTRTTAWPPASHIFGTFTDMTSWDRFDTSWTDAILR